MSISSFRILGLKPPENDPRNEVEQMLDREIHDSEGLRALVLTGIFASALGAFLYACYQVPELAQFLPTRGERIGVGSSLAVALLVVSLIKPASVLLKRANRPPPLGGRLISAFLETSLPTVVIFALTFRSGPAKMEALQLPPVFFYFPLIILSILRSDRRISIFTGLVAAAEYGALSVWILQQSTARDWTEDLPEQMTKVAVLALSGILAGDASSRIRAKIKRSYEMLAARMHADEERKHALDRFGQHVSPAVAARLLARETGSEVSQVCVMFLDIRDFTSFSEKRGPQEVMDYLNAVFGFMIDTVNAHNGIINKFLGDGFMAVFGAPISDGRDCQNALETAQDILAGVEERVKSGALPPTRIGIGLHAGPALTGVVGSASRGEYTVIGDVVNLASRIESLNKEMGSRLLVSDDFLSRLAARPQAAVDRGSVKVKGRETPVQVFELG